MAIILRKSSTTTTIGRTVTSQTPISRLQDALDTNFGTLDASQDGKYVAYDTSLGKFVLSSADELLLESVSDSDVPDPFVRALEDDINLGQIIGNIDGGTF